MGLVVFSLVVDNGIAELQTESCISLFGATQRVPPCIAISGTNEERIVAGVDAYVLGATSNLCPSPIVEIYIAVGQSQSFAFS